MMKSYIDIRWTIEDVKEAAEWDLSDIEASRVLEYLESHHDANIGINWDVVTSAILMMEERK